MAPPEEVAGGPADDSAARRTFAEWGQRAITEWDELDARSRRDAGILRARQVDTLATAAASRELGELVDSGPLPEQVLRSTGTAQPDRPAQV